MKRSTPPAAILVVGLLAVGLFGVTVTSISDKTPILKLKPELEKKDGLRGFKARFMRGDDPYLAVDAPAAVMSGAIARRQLAGWALARYVEIAKRTVVSRIEVAPIPPDAGPRPTEIVTSEQLGLVANLEGVLPAILAELDTATGRRVTATTAPGITGVVVLVAISRGQGDDADVARRAVRRFEAQGASLVIVTVDRAPDEPLVRGWGADLPALAPHLLPARSEAPR